MPKSTTEKLAVIGPEYFRELGFKSLRDLIEDERSSRRNIRIQTLLDLRKDGKSVLREIVFDMMDEVRVMTGVKHFIDIEGLKYFVDYVIDEHSRLTVGDLQVYCRNIITGKYGNTFENISVQKLIMWLREYDSTSAEKIYQIKRTMEKEKQEHDGEVDRKGLMRMSEIFGRANEKYLNRIAEKEVQRNQTKYRDIWDYLDRNDIDPDKFLADFTERHARVLRAKGYEPEKLDSILFQKMILWELQLFVIDENNKLARAGVNLAV